MSFREFDINPLYCVCLRGFTYQCGLKHADEKLQMLQDKENNSST